MADTASVFVAGDTDRDRIADMLARAFADDPATSFIFPDPVERAKRLPRLFRLLYDEDSAHGLKLVTREGEAATLWREPGYARTGLWPMLRQAIPMLRTFGPAIGRALSVANAIDAHLPQGKYWYLHIAGCDPVAQGKGYGGAAVRGGLQRAMPNLPAHLETATERNLGFYRGLGFEITGEYVVPRGGPRFWTMWRPAAGGD